MTVASTITIERAEESDLPALLALLSDLNLPQDGFADHVERSLVARSGDQVVGCAALEVYGRSALLRSVAVSPAVQGQGVGHQLVEAALAQARETQLQRIYLLTETAAGFFPRFGFKEVSRDSVDDAVKQSVEFTSACPASAIVMVKEIGVLWNRD
jgi:amino-acid N-acetyltransferase